MNVQEIKKAVVLIRLSKADKLRLKLRAELQGKTVSDLVREEMDLVTTSN